MPHKAGRIQGETNIMKILAASAILACLVSSGAMAQSAQERATLNRDGNASRHEEGVLQRDIHSGRGSVRADERAISRDQAVQRRDAHNEAVERRNARNAERFKERHHRT